MCFIYAVDFEKLFKDLLILFYVCALSPCMYEYHRHAWLPWSSEEDIRPPRTRVKDGREPPHGCWDLNTGLLQEPQVPLTAGPSLNPHIGGFLFQH